MKNVILYLVIICFATQLKADNFVNHGEVTVHLTKHLREHANFAGVFELNFIEEGNLLRFTIVNNLYKNSPNDLCISLSDVDEEHRSEINDLKINNHYILAGMPFNELTNDDFDCEKVISLLHFTHIGLFIIKRTELTEELMASGLLDDEKGFLPLVPKLLKEIPNLSRKEQIFCSLEILFRRKLTRNFNDDNWNTVTSLIKDEKVNAIVKKFLIGAIRYNKETFGVDNLVNLSRDIIDKEFIEKPPVSYSVDTILYIKSCINVLKYNPSVEDLPRLERIMKLPYQYLVGFAFNTMIKIDKPYALNFGRALLNSEQTYLSKDNRYYVSETIKKHSK